MTETKIQPFPNGTAYADWTVANCERCAKQGACPLEDAIAAGYCSDGTIAPDVAAAIGCPPEGYARRTCAARKAKPDEVRQRIEGRLEDIEAEIEDLKDERSRLEDELEAHDKEYPRPPEPRRVGAFEFDGDTWHTDGFRAVRGPWPGLHELTLGLKQDAAASMAEGENTPTPIVTVMAEGEDFDGVTLALLSNGQAVNRAWLIEALVDDATIHAGRSDKTAVTVRQGNKLLALIMPVNRSSSDEWRCPTAPFDA